jgi:putative membrane protein
MHVIGLERLPYCGAPPSPGTVFARWNTDPVLLTALAGFALLYALGARRAALPAWRLQAGAAGLAVAALALTSPLCALSVSLFAARVGQHMVLALIAAPLIALGEPLRGFSKWRAKPGGRPIAAALLFAGLLAFWHAPVPYELTFASTPIYWAMHLSLIGSAVWLWSEIFAADGAGGGSVVAAALIGMVGMGLVGALITFAPHSLYARHALTTAVWGFTPLEDQQLGGAIMWVPGGSVFLAAAVASLWRALCERAPRLFGPRP